jgi:hypothetical protein
VEFKYVIKSVDGTLICWQPGENKVIKVSEPGVEVSVNGSWDMPMEIEAPEASYNDTETIGAAAAIASSAAAAASSAAAAASSAAAAASSASSAAADGKGIIEAFDYVEMAIDAAEVILDDVVEKVKDEEEQK